MSGTEIPSDLLLTEEELKASWDLADHSVLEARQTFDIPNSNSSQNIKKELEEIWAGNRSYGLFSLVENTGGLHEFMPDPERSQFMPDRDLPKMAADMTLRAKRALLKGIPAKLVMADLERRLPIEPEYRRYFAKALKEIEAAAGLIGTIYIDPSLFSSCAEGLRFMATAKVHPSYVLELQDCKACVYKCGSKCALFGKRIEAQVPWTDRFEVMALLKKAMAETGVTPAHLVRLKKAGFKVKEIIRAVYTDPTGKETKQSWEREKEYTGEQTEAPQSDFDKPLRNERDYTGVAVQALYKGVTVERVAEKVLAKTQSWPETVRVLRAALTHVATIRQAQLPCPACEALATTRRGKRVAALLPQTLAITKAGACPKCGRDFTTHTAYWGRPFQLPGMRPDVVRKATKPPMTQGPSQGVIWEQSAENPRDKNPTDPEPIPQSVFDPDG